MIDPELDQGTIDMCGIDNHQVKRLMIVSVGGGWNLLLEKSSSSFTNKQGCPMARPYYHVDKWNTGTSKQ
jgi:hypothetical protein